MKRLLIVIIILSTITLVGCQSKDIVNANRERGASNHIIDVIAKKDYSEKQNDLVYHNYGSAVELSEGSSLTIMELDLELKGEAADIYVVNMLSDDIIELKENQLREGISFIANTYGIYQVIAVTDSGKLLDLTPKAQISTSTNEDPGEYILLK